MNTKSKRNAKDYFTVFMFSVALGIICGVSIWVFLTLMHYSIDFLWKFLPKQINSPYYTIIVCMIGAIAIGLIHKKFGDYPEEMAVVFAKIKRDGSYDYSKVPIYALAAFVPLILGASIGPEAGLVGVIAGLCSFVKHKFSILNQQFSEVAHVGFSAALAVVFQSPLFGFIEPIESEDFTLPKRKKTVLYFTVILAAFGAFLILQYYVPSPGGGIHKIEGFASGKWEWLFMIPCVLIGYIAGFLFLVFEKYVGKAYGLLKNRPIIKALIGGLILGVLGTILPYTMFSGEEQIGEMAGEWQEMGAILLLITALAKIFLTTSCINSGFKGGHFFPIIFAGIALGFSFSIIFGINPAFSCACITAALLGSTLRKPVASALLLLLCFPLDSLIVLLVGAVLGSVLPIPKSLIEHDPDVVTTEDSDSQNSESLD